jgi:MFS family permease|tara:strand:- start:159 stop:1322 length:1164 start_codon:yes stop_codon:yes gene_type:complete
MSAMQMQMLSRGYLVYDMESSGSLLGLVNVGASIPMLVLPLFGGVLADRINRKRIIQAGQIAAALIAFSVFVLIRTERIEWFHLLVSSIMQGTMFALMMPARQALIPQLVGKGLLSNALALNTAAMSATTLAAPSVAGVLYGYFGPSNVYLLIGILSLGSCIATLFIRHNGDIEPDSKSHNVEGKGAINSLLIDISEGLKYVKSQRLIMVLLIMALATTVLAQPFRFLMPIFVVDVYNLGPESMGLLMSVMGLGALAGSIYIAAHGNKNRGRILLVGSFVSGLSLLGVAVVPIYMWAVLFMIPLGLGDASRRTIIMTLIMEKSEERYRGRVMSIFMLNFGLMPLGVLPAGVISDLFGGQMAIGILAVLLIMVTSWVWFYQDGVRNSQ